MWEKCFINKKKKEKQQMLILNHELRPVCVTALGSLLALFSAYFLDVFSQKPQGDSDGDKMKSRVEN